MKKKFLALFLSGLLGLGVCTAGCGSGKANSSDAAGISSSGSSMDMGSVDMEYVEGGTASGMSETDSAGGVTLEGSAAKSEQSMSEKLIYTYRYSVETKEFDTFLENISAKTGELGGYVESSETEGSSADGVSRYARLTLRIPADAMDQMLSMVRTESNVTYQNVSSENVTLQYVDMQSHIEALQTEQEALLRLLEQAEQVEDIISLQSQLTEVRYEIESYESQLRTYDNLITYSTLYLDISEVVRTTSVTSTQTSFGDEIRIRFGDNLYAVGCWLRGFVIWLIGSLPILVPLAVVVWIVVYVCRKKGRQKVQRKHVNSGSYQSIYQKAAKTDEAEQISEDTLQAETKDGNEEDSSDKIEGDNKI